MIKLNLELVIKIIVTRQLLWIWMQTLSLYLQAGGTLVRLMMKVPYGVGGITILVSSDLAFMAIVR